MVSAISAAIHIYLPLSHGNEKEQGKSLSLVSEKFRRSNAVSGSSFLMSLIIPYI